MSKYILKNTDFSTHIINKVITVLLILFFYLSISMFAHAAIDVYHFDNDQQEQQYRELIEEFRCPKCQNQNLASSDSIISQDLKKKTYELVMAGKSDDEIRHFMLERYGDFITYNPPIRPTTYILWYFPPILLLMLLGFWIWRTKQSSIASVVESPDVENLVTDENISSSDELNDAEKQQLQTILQKHSESPKYADNVQVSESGINKIKEQ